MNNKIVFSSNKGYHLPNLNKESPSESIIQNKKIVTFGFDFFNWGNDIDVKRIEEIEQDSNHTDQDEEDEDDNTGNNEDDHTGNNEDEEDDNGEDGDEEGEDGDTVVEDNNEQGDLENSKDEISDTRRKKIKNSNKLNNKKVNKNIKSGKKVKLSKDERKEARKLKKQFKKDKKNRKAIEKLMISNGNNNNFYIPNDINEKVLNLKQIYKEILKILENKINNSNNNSNNSNNNSNNSNNIVTIEDISLSKEDLYNFLEDEWLNDNNIAFIYELLLKYQIKPILNKKYKFPNKEIVENTIQLLMPTFTFLLMHSTDPNLLKGVLPPIEKSKFIFLPVNDNEDLGVGEGGSHWSLLLISLVDNTAIIYDSMLLANETETLKLIKNLEVYLGVKLKVINDDQTPQQINGNDCGLLVIINSIILLNRILNVPNDTYLNLNLHNLLVNAVDGRLFIMNLVKLIVSKDNNSKLLTLHL